MLSHYERTITRGQQHFENRRFEAAAEAFAMASRMAPGDDRPLFNHTLALQELGRTDAARTAYEKIKSRPLRLMVLVNLAKLDIAAISNADLSDLTAAAASPSVAPDARMEVLFALGHVLDNLGRYDLAFAAFAEGNGLKAASLDFHEFARREAEAVAKAKRDFTPSFLGRWAGLGHPSAAPIFVVGRSDSPIGSIRR
ncbi:MAG: hypothetical protein ACHP7P_16480 [Terriglobales bacterium]